MHCPHKNQEGGERWALTSLKGTAGCTVNRGGAGRRERPHPARARPPDIQDQQTNEFNTQCGGKTDKMRTSVSPADAPQEPPHALSTLVAIHTNVKDSTQLIRITRRREPRSPRCSGAWVMSARAVVAGTRNPLELWAIGYRIASDNSGRRRGQNDRLSSNRGLLGSREGGRRNSGVNVLQGFVPLRPREPENRS